MSDILESNGFTTSVDFAGLRNIILFVNITPRLASCTISISTIVVAEFSTLSEY